MATKKDIGTAFKESLAHYSDQPDAIVWEKIEIELKKKKRRPLFIWWFGGLALLIIGFFVINHFTTDTILNTNQQTVEPSIEHKTNTPDYSENPNDSIDHNSKSGMSNDSILNPYTDENHKNPVNSQNPKGSINNKSFSSSKPRQKTSTLKRSITSNQSTINANSSDKKSSSSNKPIDKTLTQNSTDTSNQSTITTNSSDKKSYLNNSLEDASNKEPQITSEDVDEDTVKDTTLVDEVVPRKRQPKKESTKDSLEKKKSHSKWSVSAYPIINYNDTFQDNSVIDSRLDSINKTQDLSITYGAFFSYHSTDRFSVRIGVNKLRLNRTTQNISSSAFTLASFSFASFNNFDDFINNTNTFDIQQEVEYLEIPLEIRYKFYNKKIAFYGTTGVSFMTILDNNLTARADNGLIMTGKSTNINNINVSLNLGVGFQTKIFNKLFLNLEPIFKYQIRPYNNSNGTHPYIINVLFGIEYKF